MVAVSRVVNGKNGDGDSVEDEDDYVRWKRLTDGVGNDVSAKTRER